MSALQAAIDAVNAEAESFTDDSQRLVAAKCRALLRGYDARWKNAGYVTVDVEKTLFAPLVNPETNAKSRTFELGGKLDVIAKYQGRVGLIDHKTTTEDCTDPDAPYWRQLVVDGQASQYGILGWANGSKFEWTIWDVIRKPQTRPKKLTKAERASALAKSEYFGTKLSRQSTEALVVEESETVEMYEARLTHDCTQERPEWFYQRKPVPRVDHELVEYAQQQWDVAQDIITTRATERHHKNPGACMLYGTPCKFLGVCSGYDTIDSDNWQRKRHKHAELGDVGTRDVLSHSRIRCFQTCKRKHFYEYELAVERVNEEEREALFFGTLLHIGLEAWFRCFIEAEPVGVSQ